MMRVLGIAAGVLILGIEAHGGELTVDLGPHSESVALVGAVIRWDRDGMPARPVDPKARIDAPHIDAQALAIGGGRFSFRDLPAGRYDLVVLAEGNRRIEGFHYPPIEEFDPFWPGGSAAPDDETDAFVRNDIAQARHYENRVEPLFLAGDEKQVRVLMQLVRDQPTSYDAEYGQPIATVRHEFWQYTWRYGAWVKDKRTRVVDRILLPKAEFQRWQWVWTPALGGIDVGSGSVTVRYPIEPGKVPADARG